MGDILSCSRIYDVIDDDIGPRCSKSERDRTADPRVCAGCGGYDLAARTDRRPQELGLPLLGPRRYVDAVGSYGSGLLR
jgi:hypothetical protein